MTDRPRPPGGVSKPVRSNTATSSASSSTASSVRRNLFQSQLTRRPTAPGSSSSSSTATTTSTSAETLRLDGGGGATEPQQQAGSSRASSPGSHEIVVRDGNGEIELGNDPPTPTIDDPDEVALDARLEGEKERQRLAEAVKQHQIERDSVPAQPEELLEAVRASLRAKVAALAEDNWMFEREELPRHQG
ncbi:hypothetical protein B0T25DRAFT_81471 [Lasiosphaeria hispida]|uniref:Uncharacterized protein n=1 Tax=Lasiosphaeria hispida TaxID=260671 RepID=A0AAJ0HPC0_9PEZI|nr:hypothetical protein B0T25DRAFT_81471 [Lasiosphaeria hispida]